jgi:vacuolar iron transporter family protein
LEKGEARTAAYRANLQDEIDSAALYGELSKAEENPELGRVNARLAEVEEEHAAFWEEKLREAGQEVPPRRVGWRSRVLAMLARRFGPQLVVPTISSIERADSHAYAGQEETSGTPLPSQERSHASCAPSPGRHPGASKAGPLLGSRARTGPLAATP